MIILVTQFAAAEGHEGSSSGISALGVDSKAFIIQLITFGLAYLILRKFVFQRVVDVLQKRQETIEKGVTLTTELTKQKEKLDREVTEAHRKVRREAEQIIADSHAQASQILKEAEAEAVEKAAHILQEAQKKIQEETANARRKLEREMVELVVEATETVTREKLDAKKDNALIANALKGRA